MKRLFLLLLCLFLLTGCASNPPETTAPAATEGPTEPPISWIEELGTPWDEEGALVEVPLNIPNGLHYANSAGFDGDLLLRSVDDHRGNVRTLELCILELDTGAVTAQRELDFKGFVSPQILEDKLFLCDSQSGTVLELNNRMEIVSSWNAEPIDGSFYMGAEDTLYIHQWDGGITVQNLNTGEKKSLLDEDVYIDYFSLSGNVASVEYFEPVTGTKKTATLDLMTGQLQEVGLNKDFTNTAWRNGTWLCETYHEGSTYYIGDSSGSFLYADLVFDTLRLIDGNTLLRTMEDGCHISLHDSQGRALAQAQLTASPYSHVCGDLIPSEAFGGYFVLVGDYGSSNRLLYWDTTKGSAGEDIPFVPVPGPEEAQRLIQERVENIENTYGLNILVGSDTAVSFFDFSVEQITDWELVDDALDILEKALEKYPENFFPQLRYDTIRSVEIHLTGTISATNAEYVHTYEAFVQEEYDKQVMVVDINQADEDTYFHEFSHIIDAFLAWDALYRDDALFSEDGWNNLNPSWFPGYTWSYSWEQEVQDYTCFVDSYSTIKPTEDRARVLEYGMSRYGSWTFEDAPVLLAKLDYYCRCIRDAFDTTGWPDQVLWEQYLP